MLRNQLSHLKTKKLNSVPTFSITCPTCSYRQIQRAEQKRLEDLIGYIFQRIEEIACESAVATPPDEMLFTVCHTIASAKGLETEPVLHPLPVIEGSGLDGEWSLLASLFVSKDESDGQLASSWLLSLLVAVADKERLEGKSHILYMLPKFEKSLPSER